MYRIAIALLLTALLSFAFAGCGGGSAAPVPNAGDPTATGNQNITDTQVFVPIGPSQVVGDHTTSVLPDQLNVLTGASSEELNAQLSRYGISVLAKSGGWATLQLPAGTDLNRAKAELEKEYNIAKAETINVLHTPRVQYDYPDAIKAPSYVPFDPMYANGFLSPVGPGVNNIYPGQAGAMDTHGFQTAWDVSLNANVAARPCRIAIIGAGFWDFTLVDWPTFDESRLDSDVSAFVASDGTATTGLDQVVWEIFEDTEFDVRDEPFDDAASIMLGMLADDIGDPEAQTGYFPRYFDFDGDGEVDADPDDPEGNPNEVWNVGAAGINPNAEFILIKTGQAVGETWEYNDNEIAQAIKYAAGDSADDNGGLWPNGGCEADIILLSMFAEGAVGAVISNEVQTARDNNVLVIAPAGDVIDLGVIGDPAAWVGIPVDIGVDPVTPASDPNVIAVTATGPNRAGEISDVVIDTETYTNLQVGWYPNYTGLLNYSSVEVAAGYANTGGDIAATGFGLGWRFDPLFQFGDGTEESPLQYSFFGYNYFSQFNRFGAKYSAAYVAGAASIVHQILYEVNNLEPTDDEVWQIIADTVRYDPLSGVANNGGLLDAGAAAINAVNGGTLYQPSMYLDSIVVSQPPSYVAIESDFEVTPTVQLGTAPFTLRIDWDNGEEEVEVPAWVNGDPVALTGGWDTLGLKGINLEIEDADGQLVTFALAIHVTARLGVGISAEDVNGTLQLPTGDPAAFNVASGTSYRWRANPTNVYTGEIDGTPNETTFSWDFDGDGTEDATGVAPAFGYPAAGNYTLQLLVSETVRPDILFTVTVNAS